MSEVPAHKPAGTYIPSNHHRRGADRADPDTGHLPQRAVGNQGSAEPALDRTAYGVLVAVFQWGWGRSLTGLTENVPIESYVPMMMFAIVFGLSMDYEVFLLSRIPKAWHATGDATGSVATGLASTAWVITGAALIMVCVFTAFIASTTVVVKMLALGLAVSVMIDASIVRLVLVPAFMMVLGKNNWWLPAWLDRLLPHLGAEDAQ